MATLPFDDLWAHATDPSKIRALTSNDVNDGYDCGSADVAQFNAIIQRTWGDINTNRRVSAGSFKRVLSIQNNPPGSPNDGATYAIGISATGAFSGSDGGIAMWNAHRSRWEIDAPLTYRVIAASDGNYYAWRDGNWFTHNASVTHRGLALQAIDAFDSTDNVGFITPLDAWDLLEAERNAVGLDDNLLSNDNFILQQRNMADNQFSPPASQSLIAGEYGPDRWRGGTGGCDLDIDSVNFVLDGIIEQEIEAFSQGFANNTYTFSIPLAIGSTLDVTLGTEATQQIVGDGSYKAVTFTISAGHTGNLILKLESVTATATSPRAMKLENRSFATEYNQRTRQAEFVICNRYCQRLVVKEFVEEASRAVQTTLNLRQIMRAAPTATATVGTETEVSAFVVQATDARAVFIRTTSTAAGGGAWNGEILLESEV